MPYLQTTLSELLGELKGRWESQPFWADEEGRLYLNQALRFWNLLTGMWQTKVLILTPSPASPWIPLPGSLTYGTRVSFAGRPNLELTSIPELNRLHPRWRGETTASGGPVPSTPRRWAPVGMTQLAIWPADASGGNSLLVDGCASTPILTLPGDFVDLGDQDLNAITGLALYIASFKRGAMALQAAQPLFSDFMTAALKQNDRLRYSLYFRKILGLDKGRTGKPFITLWGQAQPPQPKPQGGG